MKTLLCLLLLLLCASAFARPPITFETIDPQGRMIRHYGDPTKIHNGVPQPGYDQAHPLAISAPNKPIPLKYVRYADLPYAVYSDPRIPRGYKALPPSISPHKLPFFDPPPHITRWWVVGLLVALSLAVAGGFAALLLHHRRADA